MMGAGTPFATHCMYTLSPRSTSSSPDAGIVSTLGGSERIERERTNKFAIYITTLRLRILVQNSDLCLDKVAGEGVEWGKDKRRKKIDGFADTKTNPFNAPVRTEEYFWDLIL